MPVVGYLFMLLYIYVFTREWCMSVVHQRVRVCAFSLQFFHACWSETRLTAGNGFVTLSSFSFAPTKGRNCDARMGCFESAEGLAPARESPTPNSSNKLTSRNFIASCLSLPPWSWCAGVYFNVFSKQTVRRSKLFDRLCGKIPIASINTQETSS